jgi:hypothetical protein
MDANLLHVLHDLQQITVPEQAYHAGYTPRMLDAIAWGARALRLLQLSRRANALAQEDNPAPGMMPDHEGESYHRRSERPSDWA